MDIALIVVCAVLALLVVLALVVRKKPMLMAPLVDLIRKSKRGKEWTDKQAIRAAAADPEQIRALGKEAEPLARALEGKTQSQREEMLEQAVRLQGKGNVQEAADLMRQKPKTASDRRAAEKKKAARRAKKKQAKKQKRRR